MGIFDLFSSNKRKWMAVLAEAGITNEWKFIINEFFIKDNISIEKYQQNSAVNDMVDQFSGLEYWRMSNELSAYPEPEPYCTQSFRRYFSENRFNRAMGVPDWFYIAYPDVANWMQNKLEQLENEFSDREEEFFSDNGVNPRFFRILIERYKQTRGTLECIP